MSNLTVTSASPQASARPRPPQGFSPKSVTVFALGFAGLLVPVVGVVPSVLAIAKARAAKREIARARGYFRGYGLIKAGLVLGWLGILSTLAFIIATIALVWAVQNMPTMLPTLLGLASDEGTAFDPTVMLSLLDSQDLNSLLSDPSVIEELEQRLRESGIDPETLFGPTPAPTPQQ